MLLPSFVRIPIKIEALANIKSPKEARWWKQSLKALQREFQTAYHQQLFHVLSIDKIGG
jgi:hypothetical protein